MVKKGVWGPWMWFAAADATLGGHLEGFLVLTQCVFQKPWIGWILGVCLQLCSPVYVKLAPAGVCETWALWASLGSLGFH